MNSSLDDEVGVLKELDALLSNTFVPVVALQEMITRTFSTCTACKSPMPVEAVACSACSAPVPEEEYVARKRGDSKPIRLEFPRPVYMYSRTHNTYRINTTAMVYWDYAPVDTLPCEHWHKSRDDAEKVDARQRAEEAGIIMGGSMRDVERAAAQKKATDEAVKQGPRLVT